jgi:hypothetical protein
VVQRVHLFSRECTLRVAQVGKADYEVFHVVGHGKQKAVLFHGTAGGSEELKAEDSRAPTERAGYGSAEAG